MADFPAAAADAAAVQPQVAFAPVAAADAAAPQVAFAFPAAVLTDAGGCPYNQDNGCVDAAARQIAVFDGHGDYGAQAAAAAAAVATAGTNLPLESLFVVAEAAVTEAIRTAVAAAGIAMLEEGGALYRTGIYGARGVQIRGGTTASVARFAPDGALTVANVGDSDVVIFDSDTDPGRSLTADHSCTSLGEWQRVHATHPTTRFRFHNPNIYAADRPVWLAQAVLNPEVDAAWVLNPLGGYHYCDVRSSWATYLTVHDGSESLAMTRALGDLHLKRHGVIATPEVQTAAAPAPGTTRAVVIGSDGLWDSLQFEEARALVYRADLVGNADAATAALMTLGKERALALMGRGHDNISCAVVYVTVPPAPAVAAAAAAEEVDVPPPPPETDQQVLDCPLHGPPARNPGGLWYSMNERGEYGMYAPCCNGCRRGVDEQSRVNARWALASAMEAVRGGPTDANKEALRTAIAGIEPWALYYDYLVDAARALLLEPSREEVAWELQHGREPHLLRPDPNRASFRAAIDAMRADPTAANKERLRAALDLYGDMARHEDVMEAESLLGE